MNDRNNIEQVPSEGSLIEEIGDALVSQATENLSELEERVDNPTESTEPVAEATEAITEPQFDLENFANTYASRITDLETGLDEPVLANLANVTDFERADFVNTARLEIDALEADVIALRATVEGDVVVYGSTEINLLQIEDRIQTFREILAQINTEGVEPITESIENQDVIETEDFLKLDLNSRLELICGIGLNRLTEGTSLSFRFPNEEMEYQIGLGDLLPPEIRTVESNGVTYERQGRQGFYSHGLYLAIYNGSRVTVGSAVEDYSPEEEFANKFEDVSGEFTVYPAEEEAIQGSESIKTNEIYQYALEFMIDPFLLESVLTLLWDQYSGEFGSETEFLHMAARFVQNAENSYRRIEGDEPISNGFYSMEFLVYTLDHFNLFNHRHQRFDAETIERIIEKYGDLKGVSSLQSITLDLDETRGLMETAYSRPYADTVHNYSEAITQMSDLEMRTNAESYAGRVGVALESAGQSPEVATITAQASEILYYNMFVREGTEYSSRVEIVSVDGDRWNINNNCVGHTMRCFAGTPFGVLSGRQSGFDDQNHRRGHDAVFASNWYWGDYDRAPGEIRENYLQSIVASRSDVIGYGRGLNSRYYTGETQTEVVLDERNVDRLVGQHLVDGEMAVMQFPSHVGWVYKDGDQIMLSHSPRPGAEVKTLPLARYVHYNHPEYVRFVPLSTLVEANLSDPARGGSFRSFFERQSQA